MCAGTTVVFDKSELTGTAASGVGRYVRYHIEINLQVVVVHNDVRASFSVN